MRDRADWWEDPGYHPLHVADSGIRAEWYRTNNQRFVQGYFAAHPQLQQKARQELRMRQAARAKKENIVADKKLADELRNVRKKYVQNQCTKKDVPNLPLSQEILRAVSKRSGITQSALKSPDKNQHIVYWRNIAITVMRSHLPCATTSWIGNIFRRDHTTILHALRSVERRPERYISDIRKVEAML